MKNARPAEVEAGGALIREERRRIRCCYPICPASTLPTIIPPASTAAAAHGMTGAGQMIELGCTLFIEAPKTGLGTGAWGLERTVTVPIQRVKRASGGCSGTVIEVLIKAPALLACRHASSRVQRR